MDVRAISGGLQGISQGSPAAEPTGGASFARLFDRIKEAATGPQREADQAVQGLAMGQTDQLHQVLLSVARADLTFRLMLEVRNRLTEAFQEIQRMQV